MAGQLIKIEGYGNQRTTHPIIRSLSPKSSGLSSFYEWRRYVELFSFDAAYLRRLRAGDPVTEEHFTKYFGELLTIKLRARRITSSDLLEMTQETLFRVWKAIRSRDGIRSPERLGSFVNSVCNHVLQEWYRIKLRTDQLPENWDEPMPFNFEECFFSAEDSVRVRETLDSLAPKDAELLRDIYIKERPKAEVCKERNVTATYIRVLLHRAREKFRRAFLKKIDEDKDDPDDES
jgi:RNA polymerase sigma-70 factor (ECF subfamily)